MNKTKKHRDDRCVCYSCIRFRFEEGRSSSDRAEAAALALALGYSIDLTDEQIAALLPTKKPRITLKKYTSLVNRASKLF
jgi:hypothetical protein